MPTVDMCLKRKPTHSTVHPLSLLSYLSPSPDCPGHGAIPPDASGDVEHFGRLELMPVTVSAAHDVYAPEHHRIRTRIRRTRARAP